MWNLNQYLIILSKWIFLNIDNLVIILDLSLYWESLTPVVKLFLIFVLLVSFLIFIFLFLILFFILTVYFVLKWVFFFVRRVKN
jgi:hypothetical protein